jgi:hypothetical protein
MKVSARNKKDLVQLGKSDICRSSDAVRHCQIGSRSHIVGGFDRHDDPPLCRALDFRPFGDVRLTAPEGESLSLLEEGPHWELRPSSPPPDSAAYRFFDSRSLVMTRDFSSSIVNARVHPPPETSGISAHLASLLESHSPLPRSFPTPSTCQLPTSIPMSPAARAASDSRILPSGEFADNS